MKMQELSSFEISLPDFQPDQRLFADHLNFVSNFITVLTLNRFSGTGKRGIIRGFAVKVVEQDGQKMLTVAPGLAVDGRERLIYLPVPQHIPLPDESVNSSVAFVVAYDDPSMNYRKIEEDEGEYFIIEEELGSKQDQEEDVGRESYQGEDLGKFKKHICRISYMAVEDVEADEVFVELARVNYVDNLSNIMPAHDPLRPKEDELDTREAIWLGETDVSFLRPDLQRALATDMEETLVQLGKLGKLGMSGSVVQKSFSLIPVPAFCYRGLLAREQFVQFLKIIQKFQHDEVPRVWGDYTNGELVEYFFDLKENIVDEEYVLLSKDHFEASITLNIESGVTVKMRYESGLHTFGLNMYKGRNLMVRFEPNYDNKVAGKKIVHTWNDGTSKLAVYAAHTLPRSLELYSVDQRYGVRKERFVQCTFRPRGDKVIYVTMKNVNKNSWPADSNS